MHRTDPNSLEHYGVLGMHWGVRKAETFRGRSAREKTIADTQRGYASSLRNKHGALHPLANQYDKSANHHAELSKRYDELARRVFNKPYDPRNQKHHITTFEKVASAVVIGAAVSIASAVYRPVTNMFSKKIEGYIANKVIPNIALGIKHPKFYLP